MKNIIAIFLIFTGLSVNAFCQQQNDIFLLLKEKESHQGNVEINQSDDIERLMHSFVSINSKKTGIEGYRVQIFFETGNKARQNAENIRAKLLSEYPNDKVSVEYDEPYWKVHVGYFRQRHEAIPLMRRLRGNYSNGFVVKVANIKPENF